MAAYPLQLFVDFIAVFFQNFGSIQFHRSSSFFLYTPLFNAPSLERPSLGALSSEFQNPGGASAAQGSLALVAEQKPGKAKKVQKLAWPKSLAEQAHAVRAALAAAAKAATPAEVARLFKGAKADRIAELLETLTALGQAPLGGGRAVRGVIIKRIFARLRLREIACNSSPLRQLTQS